MGKYSKIPKFNLGKYSKIPKFVNIASSKKETSLMKVHSFGSFPPQILGGLRGRVKSNQTLSYIVEDFQDDLSNWDVSNVEDGRLSMYRRTRNWCEARCSR